MYVLHNSYGMELFVHIYVTAYKFEAEEVLLMGIEGLQTLEVSLNSREDALILDALCPSWQASLFLCLGYQLWELHSSQALTKIDFNSIGATRR